MTFLTTRELSISPPAVDAFPPTTRTCSLRGLQSKPCRCGVHGPEASDGQFCSGSPRKDRIEPEARLLVADPHRSLEEKKDQYARPPSAVRGQRRCLPSFCAPCFRQSGSLAGGEARLLA
jgi:hypothetical protein